MRKASIKAGGISESGVQSRYCSSEAKVTRRISPSADQTTVDRGMLSGKGACGQNRSIARTTARHNTQFARSLTVAARKGVTEPRRSVPTYIVGSSPPLAEYFVYEHQDVVADNLQL